MSGISKTSLFKLTLFAGMSVCLASCDVYDAEMRSQILLGLPAAYEGMITKHLGYSQEIQDMIFEPSPLCASKKIMEISTDGNGIPICGEMNAYKKPEHKCYPVSADIKKPSQITPENDKIDLFIAIADASSDDIETYVENWTEDDVRAAGKYANGMPQSLLMPRKAHVTQCGSFVLAHVGSWYFSK